MRYFCGGSKIFCGPKKQWDVIQYPAASTETRHLNIGYIDPLFNTPRLMTVTVGAQEPVSKIISMTRNIQKWFGAGLVPVAAVAAVER